MPVNQVIAAGRVGGLGAQQLEGELAQLARKVGLVQVLERAGGEMADHHAGRELRHRGLLAGDRAATADLDLVLVRARSWQTVIAEPVATAAPGKATARALFSADQGKSEFDAFRAAACWMCVVYAVGVAALYFLPETKGQPLPED